MISRWLIATRSAVLVMTFNASAIAGLLALRDGGFHMVPWLMVTVGLLFAHATNNLINDFTDHVKGVDKDNYFRSQYGPQPLEHGLMTRGQLMTYIAITGLIALAAGLYLVATRGEATLTLLALGAFFVLFYTWPLKYIGMGEVAVIIVWGPLMVGGGYYVITGAVNADVILASLPCAARRDHGAVRQAHRQARRRRRQGHPHHAGAAGREERALRDHRDGDPAVRAGALPDSQRLPVVADAGGVLRRRLGVEGDPGLRARAPGGTAARVPAEHLAALVRGAELPAHATLRDAVPARADPRRDRARRGTRRISGTARGRAVRITTPRRSSASRPSG